LPGKDGTQEPTNAAIPADGHSRLLVFPRVARQVTAQIGKSVFAVALYHALANLSVTSIFPGGCYEAERLIALILAATAAAVTIIWGRRTLTRVLS
jgi:hypothetical protein